MMSSERETRILDAAWALLLHYGYDKTTVSDIAHEAGVSKGAIYLHYESKEDLFEALWWREAQAYTGDMIERMRADTEAWSFVSMYRHAMLSVASNAFMMAVMRGDRRVFGSFLQKRGQALANFKQPFQKQLLIDLQEIGVIRPELDAEVVSRVLAIMSAGFIAVADSLDDADSSADVGKVITAIAEMLQAYLVPSDGGNADAGKEIMMQMMITAHDQMQDMSGKS